MRTRTISPFSSPVNLPPLPMGADQFPSFSPERLFTLEEAAQYLRCTARTVSHFITDESRANKLAASWVGRQWLIRESALENFIAGQESE
jgi:excisionase family DNA binding protein